MDFPEALRPGDRIAVVAPSSPLPRQEFLAGLAWLAQRYDVTVHGRVFERDGFLAGSDGARVTEMSRALEDPGVRAVVVARGGYGATRIVSRLPWQAVTPRWLIGFSDTTALHVAAFGHRMGCVHGPHVTGLGASSEKHLAQNRGRWLATLEAPQAGCVWSGLRVLRPGRSEGPLFGGNVALLCAMASANALVVPDRAIVLLEDVTERPYRIDRMLTSLIDGGHLRKASALVFGGFDLCEPGRDGVTVEQVLEERAGTLSIPVLAGAPFGHGSRNEAFILGATGVVDGDTLRFRAESSARR